MNLRRPNLHRHSLQTSNSCRYKRRKGFFQCLPFNRRWKKEYYHQGNNEAEPERANEEEKEEQKKEINENEDNEEEKVPFDKVNENFQSFNKFRLKIPRPIQVQEGQQPPATNSQRKSPFPEQVVKRTFLKGKEVKS